MSESYQEQVRRVQMMAKGSPTWDLSDNDMAALTAVLTELDAYVMEIAELRRDKARLDKLQAHLNDANKIWPRVSILADTAYLEICGTRSEVGKPADDENYVANTLRECIDAMEAK